MKTASRAIIAILIVGITVSAEARPRRGVGAGAPGVGVTPGVGVGAPGVGVAHPVARVAVGTGRYIAALPQGCTAVTVAGAALMQCGAIYYRAHGAQYEIVTVQ